jgi:deoxyribonuclease-4
MSFLGAHVPTTGGLATAPARGGAIAAEVIQVFTRNQVQWKSRPVTSEEATAFRAALTEAGVRMAVSHASYLVNLASPDQKLLRKSREAFEGELVRCKALGIPYLIFHPGAHLGAGTAAGFEALVASLDSVVEKSESVMPLLEVTAGQGSYLGSRFEELAEILSRVRHRERFGICLDTCHLFAAGYDISTSEGYDETMTRLDRILGLPAVKAIHLNDAKKGLGSHLDRHESIGKGFLGLETFRRLLRDERLSALPMILETPGPLEAWRKELELLRGLTTTAISP